MRIFLLLLMVLLAERMAFAQTKTLHDFGTIGDGQSDDTSAIQQAVDSGLGSVVFPKGIYLITQTVTIDLDKTGFTSLSGDGTAKVVMAGSGPAFHFVGSHGGTADPVSVMPRVWERQRAPMVRGLEITSAAGNKEADGVEATGTMQLTIAQMVIHGVRHAVRFTTRNRNIVLSDCHFYHNTGCGVFYDHVNLHQSNIIGCHISYNVGGGIVFRGGEVRNVHIGTCDIESNMAPDAAPGANVLIDCTEGSTAEVAISGCTLQHNSKSLGSANIRVLGTGVTSTKNDTPTQEGHIAITGNVFSDVMTNIQLDHARGVSITGNTFWEGFEQDLLIEHCQGIIIGPNDFDRNPRYVVNGNWAKDRNGLVFRDCVDCKLCGFLVKGVWGKPAAVMLERCKRFTVHDLSILDCDGIGLWLKDCTRCMVSGCLIRDDRTDRKMSEALYVEGGGENVLRE